MESVNEVDSNEEGAAAEARLILEKERQVRERRCADKIGVVLEEEGFKLDIKQQIVLVPVR